MASPPLAEEPRARRTRSARRAACDQRVNTYDWSIGPTADIDRRAAFVVVRQALAVTDGRANKEETMFRSGLAKSACVATLISGFSAPPARAIEMVQGSARVRGSQPWTDLKSRGLSSRRDRGRASRRRLPSWRNLAGHGGYGYRRWLWLPRLRVPWWLRLRLPSLWIRRRSGSRCSRSRCSRCRTSLLDQSLRRSSL